MSSTAPRRDSALATEPKQADKSLGELFGDLGREIGDLVREEFELARTETRQEVRKATQAGGSLAAAAAAGLLMLIFLSAALAWLLDQWINTALSFLIVGLIWAVVAIVTFAFARNRMREIEPMPQTMESLKEDAEWVKQQRA
jgi:F0F1-type ATP synthase assembly protein I